MTLTAQLLKMANSLKETSDKLKKTSIMKGRASLVFPLDSICNDLEYSVLPALDSIFERNARRRKAYRELQNAHNNCLRQLNLYVEENKQLKKELEIKKQYIKNTKDKIGQGTERLAFSSLFNALKNLWR